MTPDQMRRLQAKQTNEGTKLAATFANNLAVGGLIGGILGPSLTGRPESLPLAIALFLGAAALHSTGNFFCEI